MELLLLDKVFVVGVLAFIPAFYELSPASKSAKLWTILYLSLFTSYLYFPDAFKAAFASIRNYVAEKPLEAALVALVIGLPLRYIQQKLRFARLNTLRWKYGFTDDPATYEDMTVEQAQEIEWNLAEWEFPRLWQFGWISDFFRTSTDPAVSRTINASGHFINEDKKIEHQRMQATVHMMTAFVAYKVKLHSHGLVVARINEHHHRYGIKINSDDILYLIIHFGLAPVPWINKFGYRTVEPFEEQAITSKRPSAGEDANETMAMDMLNQVLYPIPGPLKGFVAQVFASVVDWDIVHYCQLEKLHPSPVIRKVTHNLFRLCGWFIRNFGLPRLSAYQRSPPEANEHGKVNFGHTPYDTMPWWQEASFWNLWGPRALFRRVRGLPMLSKEYQSDGVAFEAMGAPHPHPKTQAAIEQKVREMADELEKASYGYRPAIGWQADRLMPPVDGPTYGLDMNTFPEGTPTMPNSLERFTRKYERRGGGYSKVESIETVEDVETFDSKEAEQKTYRPQTPIDVPLASESATLVSVTA